MVGLETHAEFGEFPAQFPEIVDFTVEDDAERSIGGGHRLPAAGEVEDGEPPETQMHAAVGFNQETVIIGTAMDEPRRHAFQHIPVAAAEESGDAAHAQALLVAARTTLATLYTALPCDSW